MISKVNKNTKELALAIGHIFGDGGINNKGRVYYCNSEDFLIEEFVNSMNKVFKVRPWINREQNITRIVYPVNVGRRLWDIFGKFSFGKDTKTITSQIQKMPLKWKVKMLQAWFNDDGSVSNIPPNYKVISIKQKLNPLINFIKEVLEEFEIKSQIMEDGSIRLLRIFGYSNIVKFRDNINFSAGYRKREKLNKMIESIKRPHFIIKERILDLLKESPKTRKELSKVLNLEPGTVYGHLHGWKRRIKLRKSTQGLVDLGAVTFKKVNGINIYISKNKC